MMARLNYVVEQEKVEGCGQDVLEAIVHHSGGDMRKAITTLQSAQQFYGEDISSEGIVEMMGVRTASITAIIITMQ